MPLRAEPSQRARPARQALVLGAGALALGLGANLPTVAHEWGAAGVLGRAALVALPVALAAATLLAASGERVLSFVALPLVSVLGALRSFGASRFGVAVSPDLLAGLFHTDREEALQFLSARMVLWLLTGLGLGLALPALGFAGRPRRAVRWGLGLFGVSVLCAASAAPAWAGADRFFPLDVGVALTRYLAVRRAAVEALASKLDVGKAFPAQVDRPEGDDLIVVVVIGESARADHFWLNGYPRQTDPRLAEIGNLVSFRDAWACAALTEKAVPCLVARSPQETSFVSVFARAGFDTVWISGERRAAERAAPLAAFAYEARLALFHEEAASLLRASGTAPPCDESCDGYHLPLALRAVRQSAGRGRTLLVLQTHGSHPGYPSRYPRELARFVPECFERVETIRQCEVSQVVNAYDNTLLETDQVLAELIGALKDREALLFYVSDHGQHLGEGGVFFHGFLVDRQDTPELRHVPLLAWASPRFVQRSPEAFSMLVRHGALPVASSDFFHTVLDCAGVASQAVDRTHSLCSPSFAPSR